MSTVSKTVNPGSNPGSPALVSPSSRGATPGPRVCSTRRDEWQGRSTLESLRLAALVALALLAMALTGGAGDDAAAASKAKCAKANASPGEATTEQLGDAVLCLIGKERKNADVRRVEQNGALTNVASKHTKVMIEENCLDHRCEGEKSLNDRIVNSGYPKPGERYSFGEITGCSLTPEAMVDAWMASRVHRKRILGNKYRDAGIGAEKGSPRVGGCDDGPRRGVYTVILGTNDG